MGGSRRGCPDGSPLSRPRRDRHSEKRPHAQGGAERARRRRIAGLAVALPWQACVLRRRRPHAYQGRGQASVVARVSPGGPASHRMARAPAFVRKSPDDARGTDPDRSGPHGPCGTRTLARRRAAARWRGWIDPRVRSRRWLGQRSPSDGSPSVHHSPPHRSAGTSTGNSIRARRATLPCWRRSSTAAAQRAARSSGDPTRFAA